MREAVAKLWPELQWITDEGLRKELSRKGLCRAQKFSWQSSARAAAAAFKELVHSYGATAA